jgi:hypothetical protein
VPRQNLLRWRRSRIFTNIFFFIFFTPPKGGSYSNIKKISNFRRSLTYFPSPRGGRSEVGWVRAAAARNSQLPPQQQQQQRAKGKTG